MATVYTLYCSQKREETLQKAAKDLDTNVQGVVYLLISFLGEDYDNIIKELKGLKGGE